MWMQEADQCLVEAVSFVFLLGLSIQQASAALETPTQPASRRVKKKNHYSYHQEIRVNLEQKGSRPATKQP